MTARNWLRVILPIFALVLSYVGIHYDLLVFAAWGGLATGGTFLVFLPKTLFDRKNRSDHGSLGSGWYESREYRERMKRDYPDAYK